MLQKNEKSLKVLLLLLLYVVQIIHPGGKIILPCFLPPDRSGCLVSEPDLGPAHHPAEHPPHLTHPRGHTREDRLSGL